LENCVLQDGVLTIPGVTDVYELKDISDKLRISLLRYEIPHWKPIGLFIQTSNASSIKNVITKGNKVSKSYVELIRTFLNYVAEDGGGKPLEVGVDSAFYRENLYNPDLGFIMTDGNKIMSDNNSIVYENSEMQIVKPLIKGEEIIEFDGGSSKLRVLLYRGVGNLAFYESEAIIRLFNSSFKTAYESNNFVKYVPMLQSYDLTRVVLIKVMDPEVDSCIKLRYKQKIDEKVLEKILRDFASGIQSGGN